MTMKIEFNGALFILFIVFLVLKLTGTITWSWWWITAPLWAPLVLWAGIWIVGLAIMAVGTVVYYLTTNKEQRARDRNVRNARKALDAYANSLTRRY